MGGDCLNTGCVPSKALIRIGASCSSHDPARARSSACKSASAEFDFAEVMERVQRVVRAVEPHDSVERYTGLGVECLQGTAKITSPWTVEVTLEGGKHARSPRAHRDRRRRAAVRAADPGHRARSDCSRRTPSGTCARCRGAWWCWAAGRSAGAGAGASRASARRSRRSRCCRASCSREDPEILGDGGAALPRRRASTCSSATRRRQFRDRRTAQECSIVRARGRGQARSRSTRSCAPSAASPTPRATGWKSSASRSPRQRTVEMNEFLQTHLSEHLRLRRRRRPLPVHAHRLAPGLVLRGERALRRASGNSAPTTR